MSNKNKIELGDEVKDVLTGHQGIVMNRIDHLYGMRQWTVQPQIKEYGQEVPAGYDIDDCNLEIVTKGKVKRPEVVMPPSPVELGDTAKDKLTGIKGTVIKLGRTFNGCTMAALLPKNSILSDGKSITVHAARLKKLNVKPVVKADETRAAGGPMVKSEWN